MFAVQPFPTPLSEVEPRGALVWQSEANSQITLGDPTSTFPVDLDAGQVVSIRAFPAASLQAQVELLDPSNVVLATQSGAAGAPLTLNHVTIPGAGTYTVRVTSQAGTVGTVNVKLLSNGIWEGELPGGLTNGTEATAEDLSTRLTTLGAGVQRGGLVGELTTGAGDTADWYKLTLADGQSMSWAAGAPAGTAWQLDLFNASQTLLAQGVQRLPNQAVIQDFRDMTSDGQPETYWVRVSGGTGSYGLAFTVDATLDSELNNPSQFAQPLGSTGKAVGDLNKLIGNIQLNKQIVTGPIQDERAGFAWSVALDGEWAIAGTFEDTQSTQVSAGSATFMRLVNGQWQSFQRVAAHDPKPGDNFGFSVAIKGNWAFVGARFGDAPGQADAGAVYVYQFNGTQWVFAQKLAAGDPGLGERFGWAVDTDGQTLVVAAPLDTGAGIDAGAAYVYRFNGTSWGFLAKVTAADTEARDQFAYDVGVDGNWLAIGARMDDDRATDAGAVYFFEFNGTQFVQRQKLTATDGQLGDEFGKTVDITGTRVAVGAPEDDDGGFGAGSAYIVDLVGGVWTQTAKILPSEISIADDFGNALAVSGDTLIAAARFDEVNGINDGSVYVFRQGPSGWVEEDRLGMDPPSSSDFFGNSVALSGNTFLIGAPRNQTEQVLPGVATFYNIERQDDWYTIPVQAGDNIIIRTYTPFDGALQPPNVVDPIVYLYDSTDVLVATEAAGAVDGRNVVLNHTAARTGLYRVQLSRQGENTGKYVLEVSGFTGQRAFTVVATNPADGTFLSGSPTVIDIDFSSPVLATSIAASDLLIDGLPQATGASLVDGDTVRFTLPNLADGLHAVGLPAGAVVATAGQSLQAYSGSFTVDRVPPSVASSSVSEGDVIPVGPFVYTAVFSEAILESELTLADLRLVGQLTGQYLPVEFTYTTITRTLVANFGNLPEDNYTLTLVSGSAGIKDLAGNPLDGELPVTGTVPSGNGVPGGDFVIHFGTDTEQITWPNSLTSLKPLGTRIYETQLTRIIGFAGDTDTFTMDLDDGQVLSFELLMVPGLQGVLEVRNPQNVVVGTAAAPAPGGRLVLRNVPIATAGVYSIRMSAANGTTGVYTLRALLNSDLEVEVESGGLNNTRNTAQSLQDAYINYPLSGARTAAVRGTLPTAFGTTLFDENFESGTLNPAFWTTSSSNTAGRIELRTDTGTPDGTRALAMHRSPNGAFTLNEAVLKVNLSAAQGALLSYRHADIGDEEDPLPASFTGSVNGDGVSISADGVTWHRVQNAVDVALGVWEQVVIDLGAAATSAGISLGPNFRIKFQQYDNFEFGSDGRAFDAIRLSAPQSGEDWYSFTATAGEVLGVGLVTPSPNAKLELTNFAGTVLQTGTPYGDQNHAIRGYRVTASGQYFVRVTGNDNEYQLVVAEGADISGDNGQKLITPESLTVAGSVLGYLYAEPPLGQGIPTPPQGSPPPEEAPSGSGNSSGGGSTSGSSHGTSVLSNGSLSVPGQNGAAQSPDTKVDLDLVGDPSRILVRYKDVSGPGMEQYILDRGWQVERIYPAMNVAVVRVPAGVDLEYGLDLWQADPMVLQAEPDYRITVESTIPNDPSFGQQWHLQNVGQQGGIPDADVDAPEAWDLFRGNKSVVVAVIDSGVDYTHPDLAGNIWRNAAEFNGTAGVDDDGNGYIDDIHGIDAVTGDSDPMDQHGHGTHVAGILGAVGNNLLGVSGIAWDVQIMPLRFLDTVGSGTVSAALEVINYMTMMKTQFGVNIVVSNNSWGGGGFSNVLQAAIGESIDAGIMFVAAAGNSGVNTDLLPHYPASYPLDGIVSVAATDNNDLLGFFSNFGTDSVDIAAPGVGILSTEIGGAYGLRSGTSMASPLVAGAAALLRAAKPDSPISEVKQALIDGADFVPTLFGLTATSARLNLAGAFASLGDPGDYYAFDATAGNRIRLETATPGDPNRIITNRLDVALELFSPSGTLLQVANGLGNEVLEYDITATGRYVVRVVAQSSRGEYQLRLTGASGLGEFNVVSAVPGNGQLLNASPTSITVNFNKAVLASSLQASDLLVDGLPASGVTLNGSGLQAVFQISPVGVGSHTISFNAGVVLDQTSTPIQPFSTTFVIDQTAPVVTITPLVTSDTSPPLTGSVNDPDATVRVTISGQTYVATNNRDGSWRLQDNQIATLTDGTYEVAVTATDLAGNVGADATSNELRIDATSPVVTVNSLLTRDQTPPLSGTIDDPLATLKLTLNGFAYTPVNNGNGTWTLADGVVGTLNSGVYDVLLEATDALGNVGTDATVNELTIDNIPPQVTVQLLITSDKTPKLQGTIDDNAATVSVRVNGTSYAALNLGNGTWELPDNVVASPLGLADGVYDVQVTATDAIGNIGSDTTLDELSIDTVVPSVTVSPLTTKVTSPALSGTVSEPLAQVKVTVLGVVYAATNNQNGTWTLPAGVIQPALAAGTYEISAQAMDAAGNVGNDASSNELTIDLTAPTVVVNTLATNAVSPTLTGTVSEPLSTVVVKLEGVDYPATVASNGTWSVVVAAGSLADGRYDVQARATDPSGNEGVDTTTHELVIDRVAPTITVHAIAVSNNSPSLTGLVSERTAAITVTVNGQQLTATNNQDGTWTLPANLLIPLTPGTYGVLATAVDPAGNSGSNVPTGSELTIDPAAPSVTVTPLTTSDPTPSIAGTVSHPQASIDVWVAGIHYVGDNHGDGTWSVADDVIGPLANGIYDVDVKATKPGGAFGTDITVNELQVDRDLPTVTVDTLATTDATPRLTGTVDDPNATITVVVNGNSYNGVNLGSGVWELPDNTIAALPDGVYNVTVTATDTAGNSATDDSLNELTIDTQPPTVAVNSLTTKVASPQLTGQINDPTATLQLTVGGQTVTVVNPGTGTWTLPAGTLAPLAHGVYDVVVTATDALGNVAADTTTNELTIDLQAPAVTVNVLITADGTPPLSGTVNDPAATISVTVAGTTYPVVNQGNGTWTLANDVISPALAEGTYDVVVQATDAVGNVGADTTNSELRIDRTAPTITVTTKVTADRTPALSGTVDDPAAVIQVTVNGVTYPGVNGAGTWTLADDVITTPLADGTYDVAVQATDAAGNVGSDSTVGELKIDGTAPVVTVAKLMTSDTTPALSGTVDDPAATIQVTVNGLTFAATNLGNGQWSLANNVITPALADGIYNVSVEATDPVGNVGADTTSAELTVDSLAPTVTVNTTVTNSGSPALSGTLVDAASAIVVDSGPGTVADLARLAGGARWVPTGRVGGGMQLPGGTSELQVSDSNDINLQTIAKRTVSVWFQADQLPNDGSRQVIYEEGDGFAGLNIYLENGRLVVGGYRAGDTPWRAFLQSASGSVQVGTWHHVALVLDVPEQGGPGDFTGYLDGVAFATGEGRRLGARGAVGVGRTAGTTWFDTDPAPSGAASSFTGRLDELRIDGRALSGAEVASLHATAAVAGPAPLVLWSFDPPSTTIQVTVNGGTYNGLNHGDGTWSLPAGVISPALAEGVYNVSVVATDLAGNSGSDATTGELTVDKTAPTVTVQTLITGNTSPLLKGSVNDPAATISVTVGTQTRAAVNKGDGTWELAAGQLTPLADGLYNVVVTATDAAGNVGTDATTNELRIDTVVPAVTITALTTNDNTPPLWGTINDPNAAIVVVVNGSSYPAHNFGDGTWELSDDIVAALPDGVYDVQVKATKISGVVGVDNTTNELKIDTLPPSVTINSQVTTDNTPRVTGTISDPAATILLAVGGQTYVATNLGDGSWELADNVVTALSDGVYDVAVTVTDAAGNVGVDSTVAELTVDRTAPSVVSTTPAAGSVVPVGNLRVVVVLSERIAPASLVPGVFRLLPAAGSSGLPAEILPTTLQFDTNTRELIADFSGVPAGSFVVSLQGGAAGISDLAGNRLVGNDTRQLIYSFPLTVSQATVVGQYLFYNNSKFDGYTTQARAADDAAIAPLPADAPNPALGKRPRLTGEIVSFQNVTSYSKGINGLMFDIQGLLAPASLSTAQFEFRVGQSLANVGSWAPLGVLPSGIIRPGAGVNGSDRVTIVFPDGAITDTWLEVKLLPGAITGLASPVVSYWRSVVGDTGAGPVIGVDSDDLAAIAANPRSFLNPADITNPYDINRDGFVDGTDYAIARDHSLIAPLPPPNATGDDETGGGVNSPLARVNGANGATSEGFAVVTSSGLLSVQPISAAASSSTQAWSTLTADELHAPATSSVASELSSSLVAAAVDDLFQDLTDFDDSELA